MNDKQWHPEKNLTDEKLMEMYDEQIDAYLDVARHVPLSSFNRFKHEFSNVVTKKLILKKRINNRK